MSAAAESLSLRVLLPADVVDARAAAATVAAAVQRAAQAGIPLTVIAVGSDPHAAASAALQAGAETVRAAVHPGLREAADAARIAAAIDAVLAVSDDAVVATDDAVVATDDAAVATADGAAVAMTSDAAANAAQPATAARTLWLLPADSPCEEIAVHLAQRLRAQPLGRCDAIPSLDGGQLVYERSGFNGRAVVRLRSAVGPWIANVRGQTSSTGAAPADARSAAADGDASASDVVAPGNAAAPGDAAAGNAPAAPLESTARLPEPLLTSWEAATDRQLHPSRADVVVSGGRGIGGSDGFALLERLAHALGGAWGGSLPAVDAGWVPVARQIGQSGCFVAPSLYIAVGISGTPQHLAGVSAESRIVAINDDPEATIFRFAELGVIGDWRQIVPALLERIEASPQTT